ncbi:unnamed protein product, partial [Rotaria sp. Silwood2]
MTTSSIAEEQTFVQTSIEYKHVDKKEQDIDLHQAN